jgi:hypothetical protein
MSGFELILYPTVLAVLFVMFIVGLSIRLAKKGRLKITMRRLAALDAIDESIGRATEMGREVHFTPGFHWPAVLAGAILPMTGANPSPERSRFPCIGTPKFE